MTDTTVRINGQSAGPTHHGGFYRFHYDISPLLRFGAYPEFKGYFDAWRWLTLSTPSERVTVENIGAVAYFGLYQPRGGVNPVLELPNVGWSFLHVIPAMGTRFELPEEMGPQSQPRTLRGVQRGELRIDFQALSERAERATRYRRKAGRNDLSAVM